MTVSSYLCVGILREKGGIFVPALTIFYAMVNVTLIAKFAVRGDFGNEGSGTEKR